MNRSAVLVSVGVLALAASACFGTTITVPGDYATIGEAVAAASDGDLINVSPGTYVENVVVDKALTIRGVQGAHVTAVAAASTGQMESVFLVTSSDVTISGFTISGATGRYNAGVWIDGSAYVGANGAAISDVTVSKCVIENNTIGVGIGGADNCMVVNNTIRSNEHYPGDPSSEPPKPPIPYCFATGGVMVCHCSDVPALGTKVVNNEIYQNDSCGVMLNDFWGSPWDVTGTKIIGNNFYENGNSTEGNLQYASDVTVCPSQGSLKVSGNSFLERFVGSWQVHGFWDWGMSDAKVVGNPEREELGPNIPMPTP